MCSWPLLHRKIFPCRGSIHLRDRTEAGQSLAVHHLLLLGHASQCHSPVCTLRCGHSTPPAPSTTRGGRSRPAVGGHVDQEACVPEFGWDHRTPRPCPERGAAKRAMWGGPAGQRASKGADPPRLCGPACGRTPNASLLGDQRPSPTVLGQDPGAHRLHSRAVHMSRAPWETTWGSCHDGSSYEGPLAGQGQAPAQRPLPNAGR